MSGCASLWGAKLAIKKNDVRTKNANAAKTKSSRQMKCSKTYCVVSHQVVCYKKRPEVQHSELYDPFAERRQAAASEAEKP